MPLKLVTQDLVPEAAELITGLVGVPKAQELFCPRATQYVELPSKSWKYGNVAITGNL